MGGRKDGPRRVRKPYSERGSPAPIPGRCGCKLPQRKKDAVPKGTPYRYCTQPPVRGGARCKLHGGLSPKGRASPHFKHGAFAGGPMYGDLVENHSLAEGYKRLVKDDDLLGLREEIQLTAGRSRELMQRIVANKGESGAAWLAIEDLLTELQAAADTGDKAKMLQALAAVTAIVLPTAASERAWQEWHANATKLASLKESEQRRLERAQALMSLDRVLTIIRMVAALAVRCITERPRLAEFERELSAIVEGEGASTEVVALLQAVTPQPARA